METVRVTDRHGIEREWDIVTERCVGCCFHGLMDGKIHCCPHSIACGGK
ncbi:MAG: hypothetical protein U0K27_08865 [Segatella copri]|nr:hypothetical protein [Segatella copri]